MNTCAVVSDGSLRCWGGNSHGLMGTTAPVSCLGDGSLGQLGNGTTGKSKVPVAVAVPAGVAIVSVVAKYNHLCALSADGRIWCWGWNTSGQLGNGSTVNSNLLVQVPAPIPG